MQLEVGTLLQGKVTGITKFGVFVDLGENGSGMVHISEIASTYVREISDYVEVGQQVSLKVLGVDKKGRISLSMRQAEGNTQRSNSSVADSSRPHARKGGYTYGAQTGTVRQSSDSKSFDDMLSRFMQSSDEKISGLRKSGSSDHRPRRGRRQ